MINISIKNNEKSYKYPFEELRVILKSFEFRQLTPQTEMEFEQVLLQFKTKTLNEYTTDNSELKHFNFSYSLQGTPFLRCSNLFSACLVYGKYVPHTLLKGQNRFVFNSGEVIEYDSELNEYMYHQNMIELKAEIKPIEAHVLDKFKIPEHAVKLVVGKNYSGRADGDYMIKTINGELWFIPGVCCELDEEIMCNCENNDACTKEEDGAGEWRNYCWKCKCFRD